MAVTVNRTKFKLPSELHLTNQAVMREIGEAVREAIIARTHDGLDAEGVPFTPYSEGYAERKQDELGTADVNLQVSGDMLNNLQITKVTEKSVTLGFTR
jgi:hypothetical protein